MRIYLDTCTIQRPVDDSEEPRVVLEANAVLEVLSFVQSGEIELVSSAVLQIEHDHNPHLLRRRFTEQVLSLATEVIEVDEAVEENRRASGTGSERPGCCASGMCNARRRRLHMHL